MANLATLEARALANLGTRQMAGEEMVIPVKQLLQRAGEQISAIESSCKQANSARSTQLESLVQTQGALWSEAVHVVKALRVMAFAVDGVKSN
jgi:hypothetical protein